MENSLSKWGKFTWPHPRRSGRQHAQHAVSRSPGFMHKATGDKEIGIGTGGSMEVGGGVGQSQRLLP